MNILHHMSTFHLIGPLDFECIQEERYSCVQTDFNKTLLKPSGAVKLHNQFVRTQHIQIDIF